jgi:hypothetical protein
MFIAYFLLAAAAWFGEPLGQEYALQHGDPVLYWKVDEAPPTYGQCVYLWGYYPVIYGPRGMVEFRDVEWTSGSL